jgi:hypothetical protein
MKVRATWVSDISRMGSTQIRLKCLGLPMHGSPETIEKDYFARIWIEYLVFVQ